MSGVVISSPPAKYRPRGECVDLDDSTLADGYYTVVRAYASGWPAPVFGVSDGAIMRWSTSGVAHGLAYRVQELFSHDSASASMSRCWRIWRNYSGVWTAHDWQSPNAAWSTLSVASLWKSGTCKYRIVDGYCDVKMDLVANAVAYSGTIATLPSKAWPLVDTTFTVSGYLFGGAASGDGTIITVGGLAGANGTIDFLTQCGVQNDYRVTGSLRFGIQQ